MNIKDAAQREFPLGEASGSKYMALPRDTKEALGIQPRDVIWFARGGEGRGELRFGVWKTGSKEANEFTAELLVSGKVGKNAAKKIECSDKGPTLQGQLDGN
jgi:hypothetical protein